MPLLIKGKACIIECYHIHSNGNYNRILSGSSNYLCIATLFFLFSILPVRKAAAQPIECIPQSISFAIADTMKYDSVYWNFGDTAAHDLNYAHTFYTRHVYPGSGVYKIVTILYRKDGLNDTTHSQVTIPPLVNLGTDKYICPGDTLKLSLPPIGFPLLWSDSSTDHYLNVTQPGTYWVNATAGSCKATDSIHVYSLPAQIVALGPDTTLCENTSLLLNAGNPQATYKWQNGSGGNTFEVHEEGLYFVTSTYAGCKSSDSIFVHYLKTPVFHWPADTALCDGSPLILKPGVNNSTYQWQDGSVDSVFQVRRPGKYSVTATNLCGTYSNSIIVKEGFCQLIVPNSFTPNGDGKNDLFRALGTEYINSFQMTIFDRWGNKIYHSGNRSEGWDGTLYGKAVPSGTYVYMIHYTRNGGLDTRTVSGSFNLIR